MPTYEYHCDACEHNFDEFQSFSDAALKRCPKCKKPKLRRVYGAGGAIIFKGSGFYQTDYRSESYKAAAKADQDGAKNSDGKDSASGKTDTPASPTPKKTEKTKSKTPKSAE